MGTWVLLGMVSVMTGWLWAEVIWIGHPVSWILALGGSVLCYMGLKRVLK